MGELTLYNENLEWHIAKQRELLDDREKLIAEQQRLIDRQEQLIDSYRLLLFYHLGPFALG